MYPDQFETLEDIGRKFQKLSHLFPIEDNRILAQLFHDTYLLAYFSRKEKKLRAKTKRPVRLKRKEVARLINLVFYHHSNNKIFTPTHRLTQCFGSNFTEEDAIKFFEHFVEGEITDKFGQSIKIDVEAGLRFMYKDDKTERHIVESRYYKPDRGKRLPWIRHTLQTSTNIYQKKYRNMLDRMYISEYDVPLKDGQSKRNYWIVITKKYAKDKISPFNFTTAYPVFRYNRILSLLVEYDPAK